MSESTQLAVPVTDRDHARGPKDAPVTLVEYGDFQCPHCGRARTVVKELEIAVGELMRFVYRHFPLTEIHPNAATAAEAAEAAGAHGRFWQMHDLLFDNQEHLEETDLVRYAIQCGLDPNQFANDLATGKYATRVREDFVGGVNSGVQGTPTFFVNGERHRESYEFPALLAAVTAAAQSGRHPPVGTWSFWNQIPPPELRE